ncbi:MAG: mandelate racemase/muconate lactonizing enzyme family protein [Actinomycetes bacterium]|nr:mandelate racemase/muconate lactonizing enzyme family protein [Actinomycetota bacterium]GDX24089.1 galactonate dehydratase [Actinomycetes bacterium]
MKSAARIAKVEVFAAGMSCFVRLTTEDGIQGVGESTAFAYPNAVAEVIRNFEPFLIGADAHDVEQNWLKMYRALGWRGLMLGGAISAIDQAMWDIRARVFETPVWHLLGGRSRKAVRGMKVVWGNTKEELLRDSLMAQKEGYTAIKIILHQHDHHLMRHAEKIADLVDRMASLRDAVGNTLDIGVELHRNMQPGNSVALIEELMPFRPLFVEDPIPPDSVLSFAEVSAKVKTPMAAGERNTSIYEFREYIEHAGLAFVRPDIGIAGGFTHVRKICAMAEAHHQGILPHAVPSGAIATMAHIHLGITVPNWEAQEHIDQNVDPVQQMVKRIPLVKDGWLYPFDEPGLGMEINDAFFATNPPVTMHGINPDLREDGSVALR